MPDDLITFVIEGTPERNGNVTAETFLAKLRQFVATVYAFERAFTRRDQRLVDLEIVDLSRASPARVRLKPRSRTQGYHVTPAMRWTFDQFAKIHRGEPADQSVPQKAIDNVIELARFRGRGAPDFKLLKAEYDGMEVGFDPAMEARAMAIRETRRADIPTPWRAGASRGSLFGELRGVMDFDGERQFYIRPPSGADRVQCIFPEDMRDVMNEHLFKLVRVHGFLRYDGTTPFPYLVEADKVEGVKTDPDDGHFSDLRGAFRDKEMPEPVEWA